jgi:menaquinone-dependent protoporphyrinogen IX oxidase
MENIIIYGSKYGSSQKYAEELSARTKIPAVNFQSMPQLSDKKKIIYIGGLYAGTVTGLANTFRGFNLKDNQRLIIVTVGLSDPAEPENRSNIRGSLKKQLGDELFEKAKIFHLRGAVDYTKLSFTHRTLMSLLYKALHKTPEEKLNSQNRIIVETYGKQADYINFRALEPIIFEIKKESLIKSFLCRAESF